MRIIFAGTPEFAVPALQALIDQSHQKINDLFEIVLVLTQPDRPAGRGMQLKASPVKQLALQHNLNIYQPESLKPAEVQAQIAAANANLFIYPSPNNGQFQVRYQSLDGNVLVRRLVIYDSKGSRVYSKIYSINAPYGMMSVDMRSRGKGIYRVELSDANGNRIATGSVLVL